MSNTDRSGPRGVARRAARAAGNAVVSGVAAVARGIERADRSRVGRSVNTSRAGRAYDRAMGKDPARHNKK